MRPRGPLNGCLWCLVGVVGWVVISGGVGERAALRTARLDLFFAFGHSDILGVVSVNLEGVADMFGVIRLAGVVREDCEGVRGHSCVGCVRRYGSDVSEEPWGWHSPFKTVLHSFV